LLFLLSHHKTESLRFEINTHHEAVCFAILLLSLHAQFQINGIGGRLTSKKPCLLATAKLQAMVEQISQMLMKI
jgi:hypothetical protein